MFQIILERGNRIWQGCAIIVKQENSNLGNGTKQEVVTLLLTFLFIDKLQNISLIVNLCSYLSQSSYWIINEEKYSLFLHFLVTRFLSPYLSSKYSPGHKRRAQKCFFVLSNIHGVIRIVIDSSVYSSLESRFEFLRLGFFFKHKSQVTRWIK
jgi:hypothetical protein